MWKRGLKTFFYNRGKFEKKQDFVISEVQFEFIVNGQKRRHFAVAPGFERELCLGYLLFVSEIANAEDVTGFVSEKGIVHATISSRNEKRELNQSSSAFSMSATKIVGLMAQFQEKSMLYRDTGTAESAGLADQNGFVAFAEGWDRLEVVYKVLGIAINKKINLQGLVLVLSGKVCRNLIESVAELGIRCVISRSGPSDQACDRAEQLGVLLIGFSRGLTFNAYAQKQAVSLA